MKVFVDSIGCRLNQSEIEKIAGQFRLLGHELLASPEGADLVIINSCAVTKEAASDSRQKARQAWRAGARQTVMTGCWVTLEPELAATLPGVSQVVPNSEKESLVERVLGSSEVGRSGVVGIRQLLPGVHRRTRAFIKSQDGCDHHCTYCVTRIVRGKSRSIGFEEIKQDIECALAGGTKEIVLSGVQLGAWGKDINPKHKLSDLVFKILEQTGVRRLRLSSVEPWDLDQDFFRLFRDPRFCPHLHLPLQSGCQTTLRRMARGITPDQYFAIVSMAMQASPYMSITTDMIVGFPGETDHEFEQSLNFVKSLPFSGGHVFQYSPRPLTPALKLVDPIVSPGERKRRAAWMRQVFAEKADAFIRKFDGMELQVLWEDVAWLEDTNQYFHKGLTHNNIRVNACAEENFWNRISLVRLEGSEINKTKATILTTI